MRKSYLSVAVAAVLLVTVTSCSGAGKDEKGLSNHSKAKTSAPALNSTPFSTVREWLGFISQGQITKSLALEDNSIYGPTMASASITSASQISLTTGSTPLPIPHGYKNISLVVTQFWAHLSAGQGLKDGKMGWDVVVGEPLIGPNHWRVLGVAHIGQSRTLLRLSGEGDDYANIVSPPKVTAQMIRGARMAVSGFLEAEKRRDVIKARSFLDTRLDLKYDFAAGWLSTVDSFKFKDLIVERFMNGAYWPFGWDSPPYRPGVGYQVSLPVLATYVLRQSAPSPTSSFFTVSLRDDHANSARHLRFRP